LAPSGARPSLPTVVGGIAYLGDAEGGVHAVELDGDGVLWRSPHDLRHSDGTPARSSVAALPAVSDGLVFVEAGEQVFALDRATGGPRWLVPELSSMHPVVADDLLLVVHDLHSAAAYDVSTGARRWGTEPPNEYGFGLLEMFPMVAGGRMFLTEGVEGNKRDGGLHAFDLKTGALEWGFSDDFIACDHPDCEGNSLTFAPNHPVYARGLVWVVRNRYCDTTGASDMELVGFDPDDGTERAALTEPDGAEVADVILAAPVFGAGLVYCTSGPRVHALDPTSGHVVWTREFSAPVVGTPLLAGHILHLAAEGGQLHAVDARTGDVRWDLALDEPTGWSAQVDDTYAEPAAPLTLADGVLYVETDDGVLGLS
jgi:outer membrane protein assembly factor BamB